MTAAIVTDKLTTYYGDAPGIADLDLEVPRGEVFGCLGHTGAGKPTTIRTLLHMLRATSGSGPIFALAIVPDTVEIRRRTGYLPGDLALYESMTARQMARYFAALRATDCSARVEQIAGRLELDLDRTIGSYSTGNRQKVAIVLAFMHDPELLVLDEPSIGLDPLKQREFDLMVDEARAAGRTVFLSSHILPEVERLADRVGIVRNGRLVAVETVEGLRAKAIRSVEIEFREPVDAAAFASLPSVRQAVATPVGHGVELSVIGDLDEVMALAGKSEIVNVRSQDGDLERAFLTYYHDEAE